MSPDDLQKLLYQCGTNTIMLDVWRQTTPISSAGSSPVPLVSPAQDPILCSSMKMDSSKRWDSASESSKGSMKNIKSSGSQTDSLESPSVTRRRKDRKHTDKDLEQKTRHSVHIFDKALENVNKIFKTRNKSAERVDSEKGMLSLSRPQTMIEDSSDLPEFVFTHRRENSGSSNTNRSSGRQRRDSDPEMSGTGTWPKCMRINSTINGTVISTSKGHKRPTLDVLKAHAQDSVVPMVPTARVPPLPPERSNSSYMAARHTPQNSDSTITYNSHPPSPSLSPQPSNASTNSYYTKSPNTPRHSFNIHDPQDSQSSLNPVDFLPYSNAAYHPQTNQSNNVKWSKVNSRNPPRMPHVATNQYQLELKPRSQTTGRRRPVSGPSPHDQRNSNVYLSPTSHNPPSQFGSRSTNTTPEPMVKPLPGYEAQLPGRVYPSPNCTG